MKIVGFHLTKISAARLEIKITKKPSTSIEFTKLDKDKSDLFKEGEIMRIAFKYSILYGEKESEKEGSIEAEGEIILSTSKDESKEILKDWKKKKLPAALNITLFNLILKRCTPKAIFLEDEVGLPIHTPMPRLQPKKEE
ncbi:MAG: hypothetical protein KKD18_07070 [Nanoarchaeota archaeon]|nr:hypothetical protein [Nanoarchaeota archaeon]MBU0978153.1 hypothetical protein [Nanoarchaeota archaeon]